MKLRHKATSAFIPREYLVRSPNRKMWDSQFFEAEGPVQGSLDIGPPRSEHRESSGVKIVVCC